jgi:hypothetical protein
MNRNFGWLMIGVCAAVFFLASAAIAQTALGR